MSLWKRFFGKGGEEDYETVLSSLAADIQKRQVKLSEIRLRERRSTLLVTLYTLAAWVAYVSLWYMNVLPDFMDGSRGHNASVEKAIRGLPVVVGPIIILFVRRIVQVWYKRKGDAEEKTLQGLMKQQRIKVEEIKKKTNYYSTRDLIQRYDESTPSSTPLRQRVVPGQNQPSTPQRVPISPITQGKQQTPAPVKHALQTQLSPSVPHFAAGPPRKQWYDKLADALLGDDETAGPSSTRYALICEKCFAHNGLVKESMWEDAQYLCPKCNHFNPSARSKKQGPRQSLSPLSAGPSPVTRVPLLSGSPPSQQPAFRPQNGSAPEPERDAPNVDGADVSMMVIDS